MAAVRTLSPARAAVILNLGCGSRTSPLCLNIDWSPYLRLKRSRVGSMVAPIVLRGERRERFAALADNVVVHDLRQPIPVDDGSVDAVYHSHVLEHARRRGETHQWMWDRVNLAVALTDTGFHEIRVLDHRTSAIPASGSIRLDEMEDGRAYKPEPLYFEAVR